MKNRFPFWIFLILCVFSFSGCKPTEKNYKAAYDAALGKRESQKADINEATPIDGIQDVDGPQLKKIDGGDVYVLNRRIRPTEKGDTLSGNYNVAVSSYKMITNCKAQCENLRNEGYKAFPVKDTSGTFFTIAGSFATLAEATKFYTEYKQDNNRVYVGLPESPVIIYTPL